MSRLIQGILYFPGTAFIPNATIKFVASKMITSGVPIGSSSEFYSDPLDGSYSANILEGAYHVFFKQYGHEIFTHLFDVLLAPLLDGNGNPVNTPTTLEELLGESLPIPLRYTNCGSVPSPTNFSVTGGFTAIILQWDIPTYDCRSVTEIWSHTSNDKSQSTLIAATEGHVFSHSLGNSAIRHYWIRFRNGNDDVGDWFSQNSLYAQTAVDPANVLSELQQNVYDSAIFSSLRTTINTTITVARGVVGSATEYPLTKPNGSALITGDIWREVITINDETYHQTHVYDASQSAWIALVSKETYDIQSELATSIAAADGEIKGFFVVPDGNGSGPGNAKFGDIWINISEATPLTALSIKRYENTTGGHTGTLSWESAPTNALGLSYVKAYNTEGDLVILGDAVITTYFAQDTPALKPSSPHTGDMWMVIDTSDNVLDIRRYDGSAWVTLTVATLANVDTQITEQQGICRTSAGVLTAHKNEALCVAVTGNTWESLGALAIRTDLVSSDVGTNSAAVLVNANSINGVQARYSVRLDVNDHISGFGLSAGQVCVDVSGDIIYDADGVTITDGPICIAASGTIKTDSTFIVAADTFAITSPTNLDASGNLNTPTTPFVVRTGGTSGSCYVNGSEDTTINQTNCGTTVGGSWVAAGVGIVGIQGDLVLDGTLNANKIVAGTITGDHIDGTSITAGHLVISGDGSIDASTFNAAPSSIMHPTNTTTIDGGKITTDSLSAISANIGVLTSGSSGNGAVVRNSKGTGIYDTSNNLVMAMGDLTYWTTTNGGSGVLKFPPAVP